VADLEPTPVGDGGGVLASISNAIVAMHREHFGRGATRARTSMRDDCIVCILEGIYNPGEQTLIDAGQFNAVRQNRTSFQDAMQPLFTARIEELTGRSVRGCFSQCQADPDMAVEIFVLWPVAASDAPDVPLPA
jgi:uncharacterized protein YbcI